MTNNPPAGRILPQLLRFPVILRIAVKLIASRLCDVINVTARSAAKLAGVASAHNRRLLNLVLNSSHETAPAKYSKCGGSFPKND
jgi:hypothetical protein